MISGSSSRNNFSNHHHLQMYPNEDIVSTSAEANSSSELTHSNSLLYSLSILKDKVNEVQSLVNLLVSPDQTQLQNPDESNSLAIANMSTIIQEIIVTASSMIFTCQQMAIGSNNSCQDHQRGQSFFTSDQNFDWYGDTNYNENNQAASGMHHNVEKKIFCQVLQKENNNNNKSIKCYDIIELDAAYLLAKYTHYCQVCGKGFKRDANLRMHMRAHGDEYKTSAALSNPIKNINNTSASEDSFPRKYSCPQEGCRWNQRHEKFQPLKSMICVKNHYKRSHCPKMYVCKRCNRKQFSVLSDLKTHEKHCGDVKWLCSCGTTFSRKDKLMGHVALFVGHTPAIITTTSFNNPSKVESHQMQLDDR